MFIHNAASRLLARTADDSETKPSLSVPGIVGICVAALALVAIGATLVLLHVYKYRGPRTQKQTSVGSVSGQPLLYSSHQPSSPRETFTSMSRPDSFFTHVPQVTRPVTAARHDMRETRDNDMFQQPLRPVLVSPVTGPPVVAPPSPITSDFTSQLSTRKQKREVPRVASRFTQLPPVSTIREAACESEDRDGQCLAPPVATPLGTATDSLRSSIATRTKVEKTRGKTSQMSSISEMSAAEGKRGNAVAVEDDNFRDHAVLPVQPRGPSPAAFNGPTPSRPLSLGTMSDSALLPGPLALPSHLRSKVNKPKGTYARPGRMISQPGRGRPRE